MCETLPVHSTDRVVGALIGLVRATLGNEDLVTTHTNQILLDGLRICASQTEAGENQVMRQVEEERRRLIPLCYDCAMPCGRTSHFDMRELTHLPAEIQTLKRQIISDLSEAAAQREQMDDQFAAVCQSALFAVGEQEWGKNLLLPVLERIQALNHE